MQDATVQSIPQTSPQSVAPSNYVAAAPAAPQAPAAPTQAPVGTYYPQAVPQVAPQGTTSYQSAPSQFAPQSPDSAAGNPWESAFNKVVNLLGSPAPSPFQAAPSQAPAQAPTQYTPANWGTQAAPSQAQTWAQSAPQISQPSPTSSPSSSQTFSVSSLADVAEVLDWSPESRMVVANYGTEAPAILNQYALNLENVLDSAVDWGNLAQNLFARSANFMVNEHQENLAYNEILTNPDVLSDYTLQFFGPQGPYPVYESEADLETRGYPTAAPQAQQVAGLPAPPSAEAPQQPGDFWGAFKQQMEMDPSQAWRVINQASPQTMANKLFVME